MKRENFYRRDPSKALSGMIGLSLEERGVYNTVLDLLYSTWRPLEDDRAFIANWCGCAVQKLNPIISRLIEKGRLITVTVGGRIYLSDEAFEAERKAVKGGGSARSGRGEVGEKSAGVREKSAGVEENSPLLDHESAENQPVTALEKRREEKNRSKEANASSLSAGERANAVRKIAEAIWAAWPRKSKQFSSLRVVTLAVAAEIDAGADPDRLLRGSLAYPAKPTAWGGEGKNPMAPQNFLAEGRWETFADDGPSSAAGLSEGEAARPWAGPAEVLAAVVGVEGAAFANSYLALSEWADEAGLIITKTDLAARRLNNPKCREALLGAGVVDVIWRGAQ